MIRILMALALVAWTAQADTISSSVGASLTPTTAPFPGAGVLGPITDTASSPPATVTTLADLAIPIDEGGDPFTGEMAHATAQQRFGVLGATGSVEVGPVMFYSGGGGLPSPLLASATATNTLVSTAALDGDYLFSIFITGGFLSVIDFGGASLADSPTATVSFGADLNGVSFFAASAVLKGGNAGHTLTETGTSLGASLVTPAAADEVRYDFSGFVGSFALSGLSAGDVVNYSMSVTVSGFPFELGGSAFFGDPDLLTGPGTFLQLVGGPPPPPPPGGGGPVPEPSTLLLVAAGWGLVARRRRRAS